MASIIDVILVHGELAFEELTCNEATLVVERFCERLNGSNAGLAFMRHGELHGDFSACEHEIQASLWSVEVGLKDQFREVLIEGHGVLEPATSSEFIGERVCAKDKLSALLSVGDQSEVSQRIGFGLNEVEFFGEVFGDFLSGSEALLLAAPVDELFVSGEEYARLRSTNKVTFDELLDSSKEAFAGPFCDV